MVIYFYDNEDDKQSSEDNDNNNKNCDTPDDKTRNHDYTDIQYK